MDSKSFIIGFVLGAAAVAGGAWLLNAEKSPQPPDYTLESRFGELDQKTDPSTGIPSRSEELSGRQQTAATDSAHVEPVTDSVIESAQPEYVDTNLPQQHLVTSVPVSNLHQWLLGNQNENEGNGPDRSSVHSELEAEAKDESWGYFMEQTLLQFLAGHPDVNQFEIFNIECRTTLCELQVIGFGEPAAPTWSQILYDMRQQPWFEFGETGSSSSTVEGRLAIATHFRRLEPAE